MTPEEVELSEVHSKEATTTTTFSHGSNSTDSNFIQEHIDSYFHSDYFCCDIFLKRESIDD